MVEPRKVVRCAIYTRKSTEDGLEQEYNSLDAQYDACAAYALSQRHEGWTVVSERYDDGGFSGGSMERPGLTRLLADIQSGKINIILLYKIDRLTRSLSDFARIVDVLDKTGASFVSITQSFNTTTSMGRLTLNMLLSFAQFEREVTGERIRDKIAASKRKGIWMGGPVPLGYDVVDRKLIPNAPEAQTIYTLMGPAGARQTERAIIYARNLAEQLNGGQSHAKQDVLQCLLGGVQLHEDHVDISIDPDKFAAAQGIEQCVGSAGNPYIVTCDAVRVRRGHELRLIIPSSAVAPIAASRDEKLIGLLAEAHAAAELISVNPELPLAKIAAQRGKCRTRLGKLVALSCIAPDIVTAIVQGRQPSTLNARRMMQLTLPVDWVRQRAMLGFA